MKYFFVLLFIFLESYASNLKMSTFNESFSLTSKDVQTKGDLEHFSSYNLGLAIQYNQPISSSSRVILNYQGKQLNFGDNFNKKNIFLNTFQLGQGFFIKKTYFYYLLGVSEKFLIFSENSMLKIDSFKYPSLQIGFNHQVFNLDGYVFGVGGNIIHFNSMNQRFNDIKLRNGTSIGPNFNFTKFYKKDYYRFYLDLSYESFPNEITNNILYKNTIGFEYNIRF